MYDKERHVSLGGKLRIITVELKKLECVSKEVGMMSAAEKWAYYFKFNKDASRSVELQEIIRSEEAIGMAVKTQLTISAEENRRAMLLTREKNTYWTIKAVWQGQGAAGYKKACGRHHGRLQKTL